MTEGVPIYHYAVLGLPSDATPDAIRNAYRLLAARFHPDRHPSRHAFRLLADSHAVVSDAARRAAYDDMLAVRRRHQVATDSSPRLAGLVDGLIGPRDDVATTGRNRTYRLSVGFQDAMLGRPQTIELPARTQCSACLGRRFGSEGTPRVCSSCVGLGTNVSTGLLRTQVAECGSCSGLGFRFDLSCADCTGQGTKTVSQSFSLPIPPRPVSGAILRLKGAGEPGRQGGAAGDCLVTLTVLDDPKLSLDGDDIVSAIAVPVTTALAGGTAQIATIDGVHTVQLNPGTRQGDILRLTGRGAARLDDTATRGDHLATVHLEFPSALDDHALTLVRELHAHLLSRDAYPGDHQ